MAIIFAEDKDNPGGLQKVQLTKEELDTLNKSDPKNIEEGSTLTTLKDIYLYFMCFGIFRGAGKPAAGAGTERSRRPPRARTREDLRRVGRRTSAVTRWRQTDQHHSPRGRQQR